MYKFTFCSNVVENQFYKFMEKLSRTPVLYNKAVAAVNSLTTDPRSYKPGNKHQLYGNRRGVWALSLTPKMRLLYTISDQKLVVTAVEVSDHYK